MIVIMKCAVEETLKMHPDVCNISCSLSYNRPTSWYVVFFSLARSTPVTSRSPVLILVTDIIIVIQINRTGY